ncbi:5-guanidino-2-oxopentanoate decarboxylase [Jannaschia aquimarina]|uniref:AruI protein n=1 Tax=Jannaschia aquimarina TaxID=935700 RepID=A0A0D1DCY1_9RHOB|nr:5-guanidino-2-oxopentanoate decarboxylase [Jannaschia aquimarina]KIT17818.1 putative 2-ketoarginine decarboxylase AruI [Jannaschia aquimarina]SNS90841.1 acetolactate synthase-1/2/3 large subunit [Jannaschia aquimarina]
MSQRTVGQALVAALEARGVDTVFGIPGVHTIELYRGLAGSGIRHVTPRHEQGAGFMADGYARVSRKPGVCFVITGPGLTNVVTAMAQARADSVPMLVITGVNPVETHGREDGHLHELPDQLGLIRQIALHAETLRRPGDVADTVARAFDAMSRGRPGPVAIEVPIDVMAMPAEAETGIPVADQHQVPDPSVIAEAARTLSGADRPLIVAGGGAVDADGPLRAVAEALNAPVVTTANGRGLMGGHSLRVPASPSLPAIRAALSDADAVLAVGTQMGPTDWDMYGDGDLPRLTHLVRIEIDAAQMERNFRADTPIEGDASDTLTALLPLLARRGADGAARADALRRAALVDVSPNYRPICEMLAMLYARWPDALVVGDSTQPVYAGNLYVDAPRPGSWFNSSGGFGTLGYGAPAAIGAKRAAPDRPVICLTGDGGLQFSLSELGTAMDETAPVVFVVWNNRGYGEIETYLRRAGLPPIGVRPSPPDFDASAEAYGLQAERIEDMADLPDAVARALASGAPALVDLVVPRGG